MNGKSKHLVTKQKTDYPNALEKSEDESVKRQNANEEEAQFSSNAPPSITGEQSVSGNMSAPESDDDTLSNAQDVGMQTNEDEEHPEEIDIARDIEKAEEYQKKH